MLPKNRKGTSPKKPKKPINPKNPMGMPPQALFKRVALTCLFLALLTHILPTLEPTYPLLEGGKETLRTLVDRGHVKKLAYDQRSTLYVYLDKAGLEYLGVKDLGTLQAPGPHFRLEVGAYYSHNYHNEYAYIESKDRLMLEKAKESWLSYVLPLLQQLLNWLGYLLVFLFFFTDPFDMVSRITGRSKAVLWDEKRNTGIKLKDVQGMEEIKEQLVDVVDFFKNPKHYDRLGAKPPKGILLVGPPGTGKTLIARAIAGEAGIPFISVSGSEFEQVYVGLGAERIRKLFELARENAPCIVFIDEIDVVAHRRRNSTVGGESLSSQTLNQLLTEIDGFKQSQEPILVIGSTNRPNVLDPAITRHGRLGTRIETNYPVMVERESTFRYYATKIKVASDIDYAALAKQTSFFSYADIEQICNKAALIAVKEGAPNVTQAHFNAAIDQQIGGIERKTKKLLAEDKKRVAIHETGHAMVGHFCGQPLVRLTIVPRLGATLGFAQYQKDDDKRLQTKEELLDDICTAMGGRAAEEVHLGQISDGAQNDLEKATKTAYSMITVLGMSEKVGHLSYHDSRNPDANFKFSPELARTVDEEARKWTTEQYERAKSILNAHAAAFERVYRALLEAETISGEQFLALVKGPAPAPEGPTNTVKEPTATAKS